MTPDLIGVAPCLEPNGDLEMRSQHLCDVRAHVDEDLHGEEAGDNERSQNGRSPDIPVLEDTEMERCTISTAIQDEDGHGQQDDIRPLRKEHLVLPHWQARSRQIIAGGRTSVPGASICFICFWRSLQLYTEFVGGPEG